MRGKLVLGALVLVSVGVGYTLTSSSENSSKLALAMPLEELDKPMTEQEAADLEAALGAQQDSVEQ